MVTRPPEVSLVALAALWLVGCAAAGSDEAVLDEASRGAAASRCAIEPWSGDLACSHQWVTLDGRLVSYQTPLGAPPPGGWPVVYFFQGSFFPAELIWSASPASPLELFGARAQTTTVKRLLDGGYAVVAPNAHFLGTFAWDTNLPPWAYAWTLSPDHHFMLEIFEAVTAGALGPLSATEWYATGVSSGGYMASRMGISYPDRFRALAIAAASYATCGGAACVVPELDGTHPPVLFVHGALDPVVPLWTMDLYRDRLSAAGVDNRALVNPDFPHGWIPEAPDAVLAWFRLHRR